MGLKAPLRKPLPIPPLHGLRASIAPWGLFHVRALRRNFRIAKELLQV